MDLKKNDVEKEEDQEEEEKEEDQEEKEDGENKPNIEIPEKAKYSLCLLNSNGEPNKFIVFGGTSQPMTEEEIKLYLFSNDEERNYINTLQIQPLFEYSSQQIHLDDTIRNIKKKIIIELGNNKVCYEEIYLFANCSEKIKLLDAYQQITKSIKKSGKTETRLEKQLLELENISTQLDKKILGQFLLNLKVENIESVNTDKSEYSYEDLLNFMPKEKDYNISIPLGQKFSKYRNLLFSGNPFDILDIVGNPIFQRSRENDLYVFENHLLMNYGKIENNIIYCCLTNNILEFANEKSIDTKYLIDLYFPFLFKKGITNKELFTENQETLIKNNKNLIRSDTTRQFNIIDSFYDIYYSRKNELPYIEKGIENFDIIIHPDFDIPLPLDIIFKQIHSTKKIPLIKYNPGLRRENIFRFYTEEISKNGKKIPFLKKSHIFNISRQTGKSRQISLYIQHEASKQIIDIFIDLEYNGNIRIRGNLTKLISIQDLEIIIFNSINPIILSINKFLENSGYTIALFENFKDNRVEIIQLDYSCKINLKKQLKLQNFVGCLTTAFDISIMEFDITKIVNMQFIRVDNYMKMNAIAAMITDVFRRTANQEEVMNALMLNFSMDQDTALKEIIKYFNEHTRIQGQYINKNVDIVDNPGFPVTMSKSPFDDKLVIKVGKINSVNFIEIIHIYLDTILRLTQYPESTNQILLDKMLSLCSKKTVKTNTEPGIDNVITTGNIVPIIPVIIFDKSEDEELEEEKEETEEGEVQVDEVQVDEGEVDEGEVDEGEVDEGEVDEGEVDEGEVDEGEGDEGEGDQGEGDQGEGDQGEGDQGEGEGEEEEGEVDEGEEEEGEVDEGEGDEGEGDEDNRYIPDEEESLEEEKESSAKSDESSRYLPSEDEDEYEYEDDNKENKKGGARGRTKKNPEEPKKAKQEKSNIFTKRIKDREPNLILTKKEGKFSAYSRVCPANVSLQPVILTSEEKDKIDKEHPGSYTNAIQYGTNPENPYWYICPRYWCLTNNSPMTEEEVKRGECGGKIIPDNAKTPPPGHFIYEFTDDKYHKNEKGEYIYHSPGFKPEHSHPDKSCLPCCYNKWSSYNMKNPSEQQKRRQQCGLVDNYVYTDEIDEETGERKKKIGPDGKPIQYSTYGVQEEPKGKKGKKNANTDEDKQKKKSNIFGVERIPIPQYRWGFLPISIELFLHTDNSKFTVKGNPALIQPNKRPLLRYGIENSQNQSFVAAIADIYSYFHDVPLPTIANMRKIIADSITLDNYLRFHNGSLSSIFRPSRLRIEDEIIEKYRDTEFYKSIDLNNKTQYGFLQDTVSSFENFLAYLNDADSLIDHTYLWDIISSPDSPLFKGGINMVILRIYDNDSTDNVELLCPTSSYSNNIYINGRGTILLLLHNEFYEPIYLYEDKNKESPIPPVKIFTNNTGTLELKQIKKIFETIIETSSKNCKPIHNRPRMYEYKENISATDLSIIVKENGFIVTSQVMNYKGKIVGLSVNTGSENNIYLPCFPSAYLNDIPKIYIDSVDFLDYEKTRDVLNQISVKTKQKILCKPLLKVVEDGLIVGILTETNQFIFIDPPIENIIEDGLPVLIASQYKDRKSFVIDDILATSSSLDESRISTVRNISLETHFYNSFRSILRNLINDYLNREIRQEIIRILENHQLLYTVKLKKIDEILRNLSSQSVQFIDKIDDYVKKKLAEEMDCSTNCDIRSYCLTRKNKMCVPKINLVSGVDNNILYYSRAADEIVRYKRIQLFMLEPRRYLNITNVEYSIFEDEIMAISSILTDEYFEDLIPYNKNKYVKNIVY